MAPTQRGDQDRQRRHVKEEDRQHRAGRDRREQQRGGRAGANADQCDLQIALIGIGAGAASALLFASVASGSVLSIFLFYVAPLPILIAALGWSHWAAAIAALGAAATLASVFGGVFFLAFMAGTGLPAWWLGYLAMLARPAQPSGALEWYPSGRLVLWCAGFAALVIGIGVLNFGTD